MGPDRNNYEIWIIDYLDGRLNPEEVDQLLDFMDHNPDIREEFDNLALFSIKPEKTSYKNKNGLSRGLNDLTEEQFDLLCIGHFENDLDEGQENELRQILADYPSRQKSFDVIRRLRLEPPGAVFANKHRLRKLTTGEKIIRISVSALSAAAAVILFLIWLFPSQNESNQLLADGAGAGTQNSVPGEIVQSVATEEGAVDKPPQGSAPAVSPAEEKTPPSAAGAAAETITESAPEIIKPASEPISFAKFKDNVQVGPDLSPVLAVYNPAEPVTLLAGNEPAGIRAGLNRFIREKILKSDNIQEEIRPYEIAGAGINGLNTLLGWQMALNETIDDSGELVALSFSSRLLKFNIPVKKSE